jgi:hypothetical protein
VEPVYVTRDELMRALDVKPSAYMRNEIDRAARAGSRAAEGYLHRIFYPELLTRSFDWPSPGRGQSYSRIYFDERSLISLVDVESGGYEIDPLDVLLYPDGQAPYEWIELDRDSPAAFSGGTQRAVIMSGLWGYRNDESAVGTLTSSPSISSSTFSVSSSLEVGSILRVGQERAQVQEKSWSVSGQFGSISSTKDSTTLPVSDSSVFSFGEEILLDAERMEIVDIAGNNLIVRRAVGGSVLAAHTNGVIFRNTIVRVQRGALGTTATAHSTGDTVYLWQPPSLVKELAQAYAEDIFLQRNSGYARTAGTGESERMVTRNALKGIEERAGAVYRRKARRRAV